MKKIALVLAAHALGGSLAAAEDFIYKNVAEVRKEAGSVSDLTGVASAGQFREVVLPALSALASRIGSAKIAAITARPRLKNLGEGYGPAYDIGDLADYYRRVNQSIGSAYKASESFISVLNQGAKDSALSAGEREKLNDLAGGYAASHVLITDNFRKINEHTLQALRQLQNAGSSYYSEPQFFRDFIKGTDLSFETLAKSANRVVDQISTAVANNVIKTADQWDKALADSTVYFFVTLGTGELPGAVNAAAQRQSSRVASRQALWVQDRDILPADWQNQIGSDSQIVAVTVSWDKRVVKKYRASDLPADELDLCVDEAFGDVGLRP